MQLIEQHIVLRSNQCYKECDKLCLLTKNLYNCMLYAIRGRYNKHEDIQLMNLYHEFKTSEQYLLLPAKVASDVIKMLQTTVKGYFKSISDYKKHPIKYKAKPKFPKYLKSDGGRYVAWFTNQAISKREFTKNGKIKLSKFDITVKTKITDFSLIDCVRVVPHFGYYSVEVVYTVEPKPIKSDNMNFMAIDLGVSNLATCTFNNGKKPIIINGRPLKSINQYYNKKRSKLKSQLEVCNKTKSSNKSRKIDMKRNFKVSNYLHKASRAITNIAEENKITTVIVGQNKGWKQSSNIGRKNNQSFVQIPHSRLVQMLQYKLELEGIKLVVVNEAYTSKCSFFDNEEICRHDTYLGRRVHRGLFRTNNGMLVNADVNGSYNIMRHAVPNAIADGIEGFGVTPSVLLINS